MRKPAIRVVINDPERLARALLRELGRLRRPVAGALPGRRKVAKGERSPGNAEDDVSSRG